MRSGMWAVCAVHAVRWYVDQPGPYAYRRLVPSAKVASFYSQVSPVFQAPDHPTEVAKAEETRARHERERHVRAKRVLVRS